MPKTSKTTTQRTQKKTARREIASVPPGLISAMSLIRENDDTSRAIPSMARTVYPYAVKLVDIYQGNFPKDQNQDVLIEEALEDAAAEHFGESYGVQEGADNGNLRSTASFHIGFAVCWLLMTQVNGGAR